MATNDFKPFAISEGANVMAQADWEALAALVTGFQSGKASSAQVNKALRQTTTIAALIGKFIADADSDALDDGDIDGLVTKFTNAIASNLALGTAAGKDAGTDEGDVMLVGAFGLGTTNCPSLADFKSHPAGGMYWAFGNGTEKPTPNCPAETGNSTLMVWANSGNNVTHYIVSENTQISPRVWFGCYFPQHENVEWTSIFTNLGGTITGDLAVDKTFRALAIFTDSIELGNAETPSPAYIDFHTDGENNIDFNARIMSPAGTSEINLIAADFNNNGSGLIRIIGPAQKYLNTIVSADIKNPMGWRYWGNDERPAICELNIDGGIWLMSVEMLADGTGARFNVNGEIYDSGNRVYSPANPPPLDGIYIQDMRLTGSTHFETDGTFYCPAGCVLTALGDFGGDNGWGSYSAVQKNVGGVWYTIDGDIGP